MTVNSRFNFKGLRQGLLSTILGFIAFAWSFVMSDSVSWIFTLGVLAAIAVVVAIGYLATLNRIFIWHDGIEVTPLLFPFARRSYRFAEFDCQLAAGDESSPKLMLIRNYQTVLTLKASVYANFDELRQAIRIPERTKMTIDPSRQVVSRFVWWYPLLVLASIVLVAVGLAIPLFEYWEDGVVTSASMLIGAVVTTAFAILAWSLVREFRRITIWHGAVDVRPVLWPFACRHYRLSDFDGVYYVTNDTDSDYKISTRERWYMKDGRLKLCIAENVYANYEELASATRTSYLGELSVGPIEQIRAALGKTYYTRQ